MANKSLIAYYSRRGENYKNGQIVHLTEGNTEIVAKKIQALVGGDLFLIDTVKTYPTDYTETTRVAQRELDANARPELTDKVVNTEDYDTIYLGYPNWWGTFPMAVFTFLESYDFTGKTIFPFCTHEGSGLGRSESDIKKSCSSAIVKKGIAIKGGSVSNADNTIKDWLEKLNK